MYELLALLKENGSNSHELKNGNKEIQRFWL